MFIAFDYFKDERSGGAQCEQNENISLPTEREPLDRLAAMNMLLLRSKAQCESITVFQALCASAARATSLSSK